MVGARKSSVSGWNDVVVSGVRLFPLVRVVHQNQMGYFDIRERYEMERIVFLFLDFFAYTLLLYWYFCTKGIYN